MATFRGDLSPLQAALETGLAPGGDLVEALRGLGDYALESEDDARALAGATRRLAPTLAARRIGWPAGEPILTSLLHQVVSLFQSVESRGAYDVLRAEGVPYLLAVFDARLGGADADEGDDLLFLLKVAAMYRVEGVAERVAAAARTPTTDDGFLWSVVFATFDANHPYRHALLNALRDPLPERFAAVAYLDFANAVAREGYVGDHPYNTPAGRDRLRGWLSDADPGHVSFALSAAAALPFVDRPDRDALLALAMDHPDAGVQLEGAWAAGRVGSEAALKVLARMCLDPRTSKTAVKYLTELGHGDRVAAEAQAPDFRAVAELSSWLAHPSEFGRPPDEIALADSRELFWPPTDDRRRLWVVRYRYAPTEDGERADEGYGLVGSVTFALFGEATARLPPEDVYALHCCWELEMKGDPRAPRKRTVAAGRKLLAEANRGG